MSRTFRRAKHRDKYLRNETLRNWGDYGPSVFIDRNSDEGRKKIAQFTSDRGHGWMNFRGPSWFHTMFSQASYRARSRTEIIKWVRDPEHEICLERQPLRDWWL